MNLRDARAEVLASVEAGNALLLYSPSGIGKSQMLWQIFQYLKQRDEPKGIRWGCGIIFAATQTPPDIIGYQFKGDKVFTMPNGSQRTITITDPSVPLWMISTEGKPAFMYDKFFLIIDEYGQGEADVKRALAEILLNGGTSPWYLPTGSVRIAASNKGARYGISKDFDFCIARRTELTISGDARIWVEDFADKPYHYQGKQWQVMPVTKAWALANPQILLESEPKDQGPWCSPRTLTAFDRYLQVKSGYNGNKVPTDPGTVDVGAGTIGMGATQSFMAHLQFKLELPSYEDVVSDPVNTPVPGKADLIMLMAYELAGLTQPQDLGAVIQYVQRLPKDMAITFISSLLRRDYKSFANLAPMQGWIAKNAALVSVISSLAS